MNNILSKILCGSFIVLTLGFSGRTEAATSDTTLLAGNRTEAGTSVATITIPANIAYPEVLRDNIDETVNYVEKFSNKKRDYLIHMYQEGEQYFPKIAAVLKRYDLPDELKVMIVLESGFKANAVSSAGAVGYWQMMNDAAKEYGLHIADRGNSKQDDRKNFTRSTLAAVQYMGDLFKNVGGDLLLVVAAYNWGLGNIRVAIRKSGKAKPSFWDIKKYLPKETKNYVMNFIALNVVFNNYNNFSKRKLTFAPQTKEVVVYPDHPKNNSTD